MDSIVAITALVQKNMALAFLPKYSVEPQLKEKSLIRVDADLPPQLYYSQIRCHKRRWISPFMEDLIKQIHLMYPDDARKRTP